MSSGNNYHICEARNVSVIQHHARLNVLVSMKNFSFSLNTFAMMTCSGKFYLELLEPYSVLPSTFPFPKFL